MRRNLTVQLDDELIQRAKVLAARRGTSVSGLVAEQIVKLTEADERYRRAQESALRVLEDTRAQRARLVADEHGEHERRWTREGLYDERLGHYAS
jgi:plasmid stability protein